MLVMKNEEKKYSTPVLNVHVFELERGFSLSYGDEGEAGQKSGYLDSDFEL